MDPFTIFFALIGGMLNADKANKEYNKAMEDAQYQQDELERKRQQQLEKLNLQYEIAEGQANKNADKQDRRTTLSELFTSEDFNNNMEALTLQQEGQARQWNNEAMAMGQQEADALSNMAASGTRSSSMAQAVDLQASVNAANLQYEEDMGRAQSKIGLTNLFGNLNQNIGAIQENRTDALDLRKNYREGGDAWRLHQNDLKIVNEDTDAAIAGIERDKEFARQNRNSRLWSAFFGGAAGGFNFGANLKDFGSKWTNLGNSYGNYSNTQFSSMLPGGY